jgi:membrane protease subunit (stomatin/prohibitin family)
MALINVIKYEAPDDSVFVWKYESNEIKLGSQLIVGEGQSAIFVKGGQALDVFTAGTYTLSTGNIPILNKLINLPFGGDTPFSAEVWFVSTTVKRDMKWGTPSSIPLMDPALGFPVSARSFGKWGARIRDPRSFVTQLVGTQVEADATKVREYFIGEIIQGLVKHLSEVIASGKASILQVSALVSDISDSASQVIAKELDKFGVELINFNIESINIPEDEMKRIQDVFAKTLEARELSKVEVGGAFTAIKSFEVMKDAAQNTGDNAIGSMLGMGVGLGAGLPIGQQMGNQINVSQEQSDQSKSESSDSKKSNMDKLKELKELHEQGLITTEEFKDKRDKILGDL